MRNKKFINYGIYTLSYETLLDDSIRPAFSPLQVRGTRVQPKKLITLLSYTYLLLINLLFIGIAIHFANMIVIFCLHEISRYYDIIFVPVMDGLTDFSFAFLIAVEVVVPIAQVLQLPPHRPPLYTQSHCRGVLWTGPDLS